MTPTPEQDAALSAVRKWLDGGTAAGWMFYMAGYAGTGKTTTVQHLIASLDAPPTCLAPTGKAASVLGKKLAGVTVSTVHSVLYRVVPQSAAELRRLEAESAKAPDDPELKRKLAAERARLAKRNVSFADKEKPSIEPGSFVIVDEASMVTSKMAEDLRRTGAKVLFVGDAGQLPPVGDAGHFLKTTPDAVLETVQRQALDNPIIRLSLQVRRGERPTFDPSDRRVTWARAREFPPAGYREYEQILTGTNRSRTNLNRHMRRVLGFGGDWPVVGEKLICLRNDRKEGRNFANGVQCRVSASARLKEPEGLWVVGLSYEGDELEDVPVYPYHFRRYVERDLAEDPPDLREGLSEFDYGYAITVHKSQGSEWDSVVLYDDDVLSRGDQAFRRRWLYTAVTRAKTRFTWLTTS